MKQSREETSTLFDILSDFDNINENESKKIFNVKSQPKSHVALFLPILTSLFQSSSTKEERKSEIFQLIQPFEEIPTIQQYLFEFDWDAVTSDIIVGKMSVLQRGNPNVPDDQNNSCLKFELSTPKDRLLLIIQEVYSLIMFSKDYIHREFVNNPNLQKRDFPFKLFFKPKDIYFPSQLLLDSVFLGDIIQMVVIIITKFFEKRVFELEDLLISLFFMQQSSINGNYFITSVFQQFVSNNGHIFLEVCGFLFRNTMNRSLSSYFVSKPENAKSLQIVSSNSIILDILYHLSILSKRCAVTIRDQCLKQDIFADFTIYLAFFQIEDPIMFLLRALQPNREVESIKLFILKVINSNSMNPAQFSSFFSTILSKDKDENSRISNLSTPNEIGCFIKDFFQKKWKKPELPASERFHLVKVCCFLAISANFYVFDSSSEIDLLVTCGNSSEKPEKTENLMSEELFSLISSYLFICLKKGRSKSGIFSLLSPNDNSASNSNDEKAIITWVVQGLKFLFSLNGDFDKSATTTKPNQENSKTQSQIQIRETKLLLGSYIHCKSFENIANFVCNVLTHSSTPSSTFFNIEISHFLPLLEGFVEHVLPLELLLKKMIEETEETPKRNEKNKEFLIKSVSIMLQNNMFRKFEIDVSNWVWKQFFGSHDEKIEGNEDNLASLLKELVNSSTPSLQFKFVMPMFSKKLIKDAFGGDLPFSIRKQSLLLYYILLVNNNPKLFNNQTPAQASSVEDMSYEQEIIDNFDLMKIVRFCQEEKKRSNFFKHLLAMMVDKMQFLFNLDLLMKMNEDVDQQRNVKKTQKHQQKIKDTLMFPEIEHFRTKKALNDLLTKISLEECKQFEDIFLISFKKIVQNFLNFEKLNTQVNNQQQEFNGFDPSILEIYEKCWYRLSLNNPMQFSLSTIKHFHPDSNSFTHSEILKNILFLFGMPKSFFTVPSFLKVFLTILLSYLIASRNFLLSFLNSSSSSTMKFMQLGNSTQQKVDQTQPDQTPLAQENMQKMQQQMIYNMINTQETAVIQILIDFLHCNSTEVQKLICGFIHQRFIENPVLAQMVHFQTYDDSLLPITVNGINSMHICNNFLIELIHHPTNKEKAVFGVKLASFLCEKYPIPRNVEIARSVIAVFSHPQTNLDPIECLESMVRIARAFPFLASDCVKSLMDLKTCCENAGTNFGGNGILVKKRIEDSLSMLFDFVVNLNIK